LTSLLKTGKNEGAHKNADSFVVLAKTVEKVEVLPTGKLTYVFKAGIRVTV